MSRIFSQRLAIIMLVIFITNAGFWNMNSHHLTHEIAHSIQHNLEHTQITPVVDRVVSLSWVSMDKSSDFGTVIEHELLHAVDHLEIFLEVLPKQYFLSETTLTLFSFFSKIITSTITDAPFRPPRLNLLPV